ncbi:hypothetical protein QJQ45_021993 [Haematococcus lacustris]|nr:hypothetical protein QJQ45_021993 [Haematococcus lacustris]
MAKKCKLHTLMRGVAAAGLEAGAVVASEVVEARLYDQLVLWVEACSKRALLASLLLGLIVRDCFTRVTVLAYDQELLEEIPAEDAVIPNFAEHNLYLQLGRGLPPPGMQSRPSDAVVDVLTAYPDLHAELDEIPRYPQDGNTVDDVGRKLETSFANSLIELFKRRVGQAVALAGARVIAGSHEHQRRFGLPVDGSPAWTERQRSWVVRSVRGKVVTWLEGQGGVVPTDAMRYECMSSSARTAAAVDGQQHEAVGVWQCRLQVAPGCRCASVHEQQQQQQAVMHDQQCKDSNMCVDTSRQLEAANVSWQLDWAVWQAAGGQPNSRPYRPPSPFALTPSCSCKAHHIKLDTRAIYGLMRAAGMLPADITSLTRFRNGVAGPRDIGCVGLQVANRWIAFLPSSLPPAIQPSIWPNDGQTFAQVVYTDGVTVSLLFTRPKPAGPPDELPRMGKQEGAVNPLAHLNADWLGCDPGKTNMATVAHEERYPSGTVESVWQRSLTAGHYYRQSGITQHAKVITTWMAGIQPEHAVLSQVTNYTASLQRYREYVAMTLVTWPAMWAELSKPRWSNVRFQLYGGKQRTVAKFWAETVRGAMVRCNSAATGHPLALAYGAASFSGGGSRGSRGVPVKHMLREACKQFPGRVVLVHEFRTSRVSSARTDVVAGQPESFRWLRPVRSMATRSRIRGLMCSTSNDIRFYDRDVSAALNIRRIAAGPGRPRELSSWLGRPAMPNPGRPGQEWVCVRDRGLLRKWQRRHQRQRYLRTLRQDQWLFVRLAMSTPLAAFGDSSTRYRHLASQSLSLPGHPPLVLLPPAWSWYCMEFACCCLPEEDEAVMDAISAIMAACSGPIAVSKRVVAYEYGSCLVRVQEGSLGDGLGAQVWTAAHLLCRRLTLVFGTASLHAWRSAGGSWLLVVCSEMVEWPAFVMGQAVLEIGSGCGVCGLLAMQLGAQQVVLTDVEGPVLRNLQQCMLLNTTPATNPRPDNAQPTPAQYQTMPTPNPACAPPATLEQAEEEEAAVEPTTPSQARPQAWATSHTLHLSHLAGGQHIDQTEPLQQQQQVLPPQWEQAAHQCHHQGRQEGHAQEQQLVQEQQCQQQPARQQQEVGEEAGGGGEVWELGPVSIRLMDWLHSLQLMEAIGPYTPNGTTTTVAADQPTASQPLAAGATALVNHTVSGATAVLSDACGHHTNSNDQQLAVAQSRHPEHAALAGLGEPLGAQPHTAVSSPDATFGPALLDPSTFYAHDLLRMSDTVTLTGPLPPALHPDRRFPRIIGTDVMARTFTAFSHECRVRGLRYRVHAVQADTAQRHGGILGLEGQYEGGFLLMALDHLDAPCQQWWFNTGRLANQGLAFEMLVDTDGVSVCVHYTRPLPSPPAPPPAASSSSITSSRPSAAAAAAHAVGLPHIGRGIAEMREFVFNTDTQIGVGIDPGVTQAVSAASGVWDPQSGQLMADQLRRWKLTKGEVKHASGLNNARRDTERWLAPIKPHLQHLAAASSAGTSLEANLKHITVTLATWDAVWEVYLDPKWARQRLRLYGAQDRALEQFFNKLEKGMAELSMKRHNRAKQLVVFFGAATIGTGGGWGADAVLRACRKVVCRPRGPDQLRGRVVLVDEHRTSRVSSAVNGQQPCEEELNTLSATRPAGWKPTAGQVEPRLVRPAWSQERGQPVRGLMWCSVVAPRKPPQPPRSSQAATQPAASEPGPSTPPPAKRSKPAAEPTKGKGKGKAAKAKPAPQPGRWLDRDCNAALNMQRIGESRWRPLELCYWPDQGALPAKGKEYPEHGYKRLRDKPPKAQQQQQPAAAH